MTPTGTSASLPRGRVRRSWLWYIMLLGAAGVFAIVVPLVYNLRQQLKPEQVEEARSHWKDNGPADYDLTWEEKVDRAKTEDQPEEHRRTEYYVVVRDRKVWLVKANKAIWLAQELAMPLGGAVGPTMGNLATERVEQDQLTGYTVEALFKTIEENLSKNAQAEGKHFATGKFNGSDGHPVHYVYRERNPHYRLEWNVTLVRQ